MTDVIEYVRRSTPNMTNLNVAHKRKGISRLYHIVEDDFAKTVTTKWKLGFIVKQLPLLPTPLLLLWIKLRYHNRHHHSVVLLPFHHRVLNQHHYTPSVSHHHHHNISHSHCYIHCNHHHQVVPSLLPLITIRHHHTLCHIIPQPVSHHHNNTAPLTLSRSFYSSPSDTIIATTS